MLRSLLLAGEIATAVADPGPTPVPNPARPKPFFRLVAVAAQNLNKKMDYRSLPTATKKYQPTEFARCF